MTDEKPRYTFQDRKTGKWWWKPSRTMQEAGLATAEIGTDRETAWRKAERYNGLWDAIRAERKAGPERRGNIRWLIAQFQIDPTWYGAKAKVTRDELDYAFKIIQAEFGKFAARNIKPAHIRAFYNELRVEGSAHKAKRVLKWFKQLFLYAIERG